jgi:hypothetical protein
MAYRNFWLSIIFIGTICTGSSAQTARRRGPIVKQVDQILIESDNPKTLFGFFSDTLQLPTAWPLTDNQGFESGGLGAGNVILELFRYAGQGNIAKPEDTGARFAGIAFEPYPLDEALSELETRGIPFNSPERHISTLPDGSQGILSTTVVLPSLSQPGLSIFLYEYSPEFLRVQVRRRQLGNRLALNNGGPLGILSVGPIIIASQDLKRSKTGWAQLLGNPVSPDNWEAGEGPDIRLVEGAGNGIQKIVLRVKSLNRAKTFLEEKQMLGSSSVEEICLNESRVQGLNICFVQ